MATAELRARISADAAPFMSALSRVKRATMGAGEALASIGGAVGIGFSVAGLAAAIKGVANFGDEISDAAKKTGIGVAELQKLRFMAKLSGLDFKGLQGSIRFMSKALFDAQTSGGEAAKAFSLLGVKTKDLETMAVDDQFLAIVGALEGVKDQSKRAGLAMKIFGKSGVDVLPLVVDGVDGLKKARDRFVAGGGILSEADVAAASDFNDELDLMAATVGGKFQQSIMSTFPQMIDLLSRNQEAIQNLGYFFDGLAISIKAVVEAFAALNSIGVKGFGVIDKATDEMAARMASVGLAREGGYADRLAQERGYTAMGTAAKVAFTASPLGASIAIFQNIERLLSERLPKAGGQ